MKRLCILLALLLPAGAWAQSTTEFGARASAEVNFRITKGFHAYAEEEIRIASTSLDDLRHTLGFTYKPFKALKLGVGYTLINSYSTDYAAFKNPKHRFFADVTGSLNAGDFQFSLKERFQLTHRTGTFNVYQNTPDAMALKSRFTVKYKGFFNVEPYASFEMRTVLNGPWGTVTGDLVWNKSQTKQYYLYTPEGCTLKQNSEGKYYLEGSPKYTHVYNNRYRGEVGVDIAFNKWHSLKPYVLLDFNSVYDINTNSEGTHLFSAGYVNSIRLSAGVSYVYSF